VCLVCVCSFCLINFVRNTENPSAVRTDFEQTGVAVISGVPVLMTPWESERC
jgi:hypothetical protein